jgi:hypothetical protein
LLLLLSLLEKTHCCYWPQLLQRLLLVWMPPLPVSLEQLGISIL